MPAELTTDRDPYAPLAGIVAEVLDCIDCSVCGRARPAEHPIGDDAADDERLCVDCGAAVFINPVVVGRVARAHAA